MRPSVYIQTIALSTLVLSGPSGRTETAADIAEAMGLRTGLVVHVGCGDGRITTALHHSTGGLVHGLEQEGGRLAAARRHIHEQGLEGEVCVVLWDGPKLPYVDNLANVVFVEDSASVTTEEVLRILAPEGVAYIEKVDGWERKVKARPAAIDEWTHFLHDPGNNAVAHDAAVGPPRHMQWLAAPEWSRNHHTLASISAVVSSGGRLLYIVDEAPSVSIAMPGQWALVARDAFNGALLWKRSIRSWAWHRQGFRSGPVQLPRTLVAVGGEVYVPLGSSAPVSALDAATGRTLRTYGRTEGAEEVIAHEGLLLVVRGSPLAEQAALGPKQPGKKPLVVRKTISALTADTGTLAWEWTAADGNHPTPLTLAASGQRVFFAVEEGVRCLDLRSGKERWRFARPGGKANVSDTGKKARKKRSASRKLGWSVETLVVCDGVVLWADGKTLEAVSADTGNRLWSCASSAGFRSPADVLVAGGLVWAGPDYAAGRDLRSGEIRKRTASFAELRTAGHHHRCYREKATDRFLIGGYRGLEFFDLEGDEHSRNNWVRGTCQYGIMPCNGLVYVPSHACGCYMEAKLYGFWALAPERRRDAKRSSPDTAQSRREEGPAYGRLSTNATGSQSPRALGSAPGSWATYRGDAARSSTTGARLPLDLSPAWETEVGGRLSGVTVAGGTVFVAQVDRHALVALDAADGRVRWRFSTGGRIDSPPTIHRGGAYFGSADGWVYCLRASDGQLAWRFRAAPDERFTVAFDRVESVWPVHGSVLVQNDVVYVAAGRSSYLDGGIRLYGLDPTTGRVLSRNRVSSAHPQPSGTSEIEKTGEKIQQNATDHKTYNESDRSDAFSMSGATTDVLVGDGKSIYLRHLRFDSSCAQESRGRPHLFSTTRLLDGTEAHRSHWVLGTGDFSRMPVAYSWVAYRPGRFGGYRLAVPYGLLLAFDEDRVWGVRRVKDGVYHLLATANTTAAEEDKNLPDFRKGDEAASQNFAWVKPLSLRPRTLIKCSDRLLVGGMPLETGDAPRATDTGQRGGLLWSMSTEDGRKLAEHRLPAAPVWDGMAAADGRLFFAGVDGRVRCLVGPPSPRSR